MPYIQVILPLRLGWEPFYRCDEDDVAQGMRASVRFAGRRYIAVVSAVGVEPDVDEKKILAVDSLERHLDPISERELKLWRFIADYYLCSIGEVYKMAYPAGKTSGEQVKARAVERRELLLQKARELQSKRLEKLRERLSAKEKALEGRHGDKVRLELEAARDRILEEIAAAEASLKALDSEPVGSEGAGPADALSVNGTRSSTPSTAAITGGEGGEAGWKSRSPVLLVGGPDRLARIFGRIAECLSSGRDALLLVPDIGLSKALQQELLRRFASAVMVYNSAESAGRRRDIASALREGAGPRIVLGTRSAIFLPFKQLGLVVVEEEHDSFYKQDGAPRYNARDMAVVLAGLHGAAAVLSSPTPSLESLHNVLSGRYSLERVAISSGGIEIVDTTVEARKRGMVGSLSRVLIAKMDKVIKAGGEALLLRPWSPLQDLEAEVKGIFPDGVRTATTWQARRMDISGYALVAIIGTDALLDKTDFRADERLWQTLEQLRSRFSGEMLIQTRQGSHPAYAHLGGEGQADPHHGGSLSEGEDDYGIDGYVQLLLAERKDFALPPYTRIVEVAVRDSNPARLKKLSSLLASDLRRLASTGPCGPAGTTYGTAVLSGMGTNFGTTAATALSNTTGGFTMMGPFPPMRKERASDNSGNPVKNAAEGISTTAGSESSPDTLIIRITLPRDKHLTARKKALATAVASFEASYRYTGHIYIDVDPA